MALYPINIISGCTGAGGLDRGVHLALPNSRVVCYIERETYAVANLAEKMAAGRLDDAPVWDDFTTFDGRPWRGIVDAVVCGIPCQPHSVAGKQLGADDERDLWPDAHRIIGEVNPSWVFLENVAGSAGYFRERVVTGLERMGFRVAAGLFMAVEVGASHKRERLFVLGVRDVAHTKHPERRAGAGPGWHLKQGRNRQGEATGGAGSGSEGVASTQSDGLEGWSQERQPRRGATAGSSEAVADVQHAIGRAEHGIDRQAHRGNGSGGSGLDVALSPRGGLGTDGRAPRQPRHPDGGDGALADVREPGLEGSEQRGSLGCLNRIEASGSVAELRAASLAQLPIFAPGPADYAAWVRILRTHPHLVPAIPRRQRGGVQEGAQEAQSGVCRVVDGLGGGNDADRLRLTGNGVVELQAAYAFVVLASAIFGEGIKERTQGTGL